MSCHQKAARTMKKCLSSLISNSRRRSNELYYPQYRSRTDFQMRMLEKDLLFTSTLNFPCGIAWFVRRSLKPLSLTMSDLWGVLLCSTSTHCIGIPPKIQLRMFTAYTGLSYTLSSEDTGQVAEGVKEEYPVFRNSLKCRLKEWEHMEKQ